MGGPGGGVHNSNFYSVYKHAKRLFRAHRRVYAANFLLEVNAEIDIAAVDSSCFWKKVNSRRKQFHSHVGSKIRFDDKICLDPEEIVSEWGCYFRKLYLGSETHILTPFS